MWLIRQGVRNPGDFQGARNINESVRIDAPIGDLNSDRAVGANHIVTASHRKGDCVRGGRIRGVADDADIEAIVAKVNEIVGKIRDINAVRRCDGNAGTGRLKGIAHGIVNRDVGPCECQLSLLTIGCTGISAAGKL